MSCWASMYIDDVKRDVQKLKREMPQGHEDIKKEISDKIDQGLSDIFEKMSARFDALELAVIDPHGDAAEQIRKKHGLQKPKALNPRT